jgi:hypothetical protein
MDKHMQTKIIPFNLAHLSVIELMVDEMFPQLPNWQEHLSAIAEAGVAFTLVVEGRVVVCGGIVHGIAGVAQCWLLPSAYINTYSQVAARAIRKVLEDLMETHHLHRMETGCQNTSAYATWMGFLGFEREGLQRMAGINRTDLVVWVKLKEGA